MNDTIFINKFPIYVINLKTDITRRKYIKALFKRHNINYNLIMVDRFNYEPQNELKYKLNSSKMGCILSHLWCINDAINNSKNINDERFIIFEDDIIFHKQFEQLFKECITKLTSIPDLLMLGSIDFKINVHTTTVLNKEENIYYPKTNVLGAHANMYSVEFAKEFFNYKINTTDVLEFDFDYARFMSKYKIGVLFPNLVICELSTTNINHNFSPVNSLLFARYKKCFTHKFTYNDYEYMIITFIDFIKEEIQHEIVFKDIKEAISSFKLKKIPPHCKYDISTWLLNGTYTITDILNIIHEQE